jgi:hypothetical protein
VSIDVGGETLRMPVTVNDLVIEGYDLDTASTASAGADLSALPAYLHTVFGDVKTLDSLARAQHYYRENKIAAAIPAITFGRGHLKDQNI